MVIKADIQIVASAKMHGTSVLYSHDQGLRSLAESVGIKAYDLPRRHPNMFVDRELREESSWRYDARAVDHAPI